jgi:hypothetical protein
MLLVYNTLNKTITRKIKVPLYLTDLTDKAIVQVENGNSRE